MTTVLKLHPGLDSTLDDQMVVIICGRHHLLSMHTLSGVPQMVESEGSTSRLMLGSWHEEHACGGNLCTMEAGLDLSSFGTYELVAQFIHFVSVGSCRIQVAGKQLYFVKQLFRHFPGLTKLAESLLVCVVLFHQFQGARLPTACEGTHSVTARDGM